MMNPAVQVEPGVQKNQQVQSSSVDTKNAQRLNSRDPCQHDSKPLCCRAFLPSRLADKLRGQILLPLKDAVA